jgi:dienelactone hydrolase
VATWGEGSVPVELVVYPGAHHAFDAPVFAPGQSVFGHWIEYNPEAAELANRKMREFLARHLRH